MEGGRVPKSVFTLLYLPYNMLSDSEASDTNDDTRQLLTINETFARAYQVKKEREELSKCGPCFSFALIEYRPTDTNLQ